MGPKGKHAGVPGWLRALGRTLVGLIKNAAYLVALLVTVSAAMLLAFLLVRRYTAVSPSGSPPAHQVLDEAAALRAQANQLFDLAAECFQKNGKAPDYALWRDREWGPRLTALRRALALSTYDFYVTSNLSLAADRLAAFARDPADSALRERARRALEEASARVEDWINAQGAGRHLDVPGRSFPQLDGQG